MARFLTTNTFKGELSPCLETTMKPYLSGITFIKNGLKLGYPIKESIKSIEPLCDEIIINVGYDNPNLTQDDGTYEYLRDHFPEKKFVFLKSWWDPELTSKGLILSQQTNIALEAAKGKYCQYIQGDEAIHESDLKTIEDDLKKLENHPSAKGLVYQYLHFYGNVNIIKQTRNCYRREIRLFKNENVKSWLDAQGFRFQDDTKIPCLLTPARIFHYGWARKEQIMATKVKAIDKLYHGQEFEKPQFQYKGEWGLKAFEGGHPAIMDEWIETHQNNIDLNSLTKPSPLKHMKEFLSDCFENLTGYRLGEYKNYLLVN